MFSKEKILWRRTHSNYEFDFGADPDVDIENKVLDSGRILDESKQHLNKFSNNETDYLISCFE